MLFKRTALYIIFTLLLTQTPSMHGISIFGYNFNVTSQLSALHSRIQNYMWSPWSNNSTNEDCNRSNTVPTLVQSAINNFSQLCDNFIGWCTIKTILSLYPHTAPAFVQPVGNHFSQMCSSRYGYNILQAILQYYPEATQLFIQPIVNNLSQICSNTYGRKILKNIIKNCPNTNQLIAKCIAKDSSSFYPFSDLIACKTQTQQHLTAHILDKYKQLSSQGATNYQDYPDLQDLTKQIIDREYSEQKEGRYTFVHAHQWDYHFHQELYTALWSIMHEQPNNYRFIRYTYPNTSSTPAFFVRQAASFS